MKDIKSIKEDNLRRLEMAILTEVAVIVKDSDLTTLIRLAHNYRKQIGLIRGKKSPIAGTVTGRMNHKESDISDG